MNQNSNKVKWYPRLLTGEMVRAVLSGHKTVTRWPLRKQPVEDVAKRKGEWVWEDVDGNIFRAPVRPGDVIWVREAWAELTAVSPATGEPIPIGPGEQLIEPPTFYMDRKGYKRWNYDGTVIAYRANSDVMFCDGDGFSGEMADKDDMPHWRPSIHMPKEYARLFGRVTGVKLVHVQDINESEAQAEGVRPAFSHPGLDGVVSQPFYRWGFWRLWDKLYAARGLGWDANPWVWAVSFRLISKAEAEA
ncbi:hypothetical protein [Desulfovibrio sp. SGI.169]|uniref:hypothetical protein n=1 Tax=Desulfovibrio sp. SGI.169 TaxID=3420561 RepID=UPI003D07D831